MEAISSVATFRDAIMWENHLKSTEQFLETFESQYRNASSNDELKSLRNNKRKSLRKMERIKQLLAHFKQMNPDLATRASAQSGERHAKDTRPMLGRRYCARDGRDVPAVPDRHKYIGDKFVVHVYCRRWIIGAKGLRVRQIEYETSTKISLQKEEEMTDVWSTCTITGNPHGISKAKQVICKLLGDGEEAELLERTLDEAADKRIAHQAGESTSKVLESAPVAIPRNADGVPIIQCSGSQDPARPKPTPIPIPVRPPPPVRPTPVFRTYAASVNGAREVITTSPIVETHAECSRRDLDALREFEESSSSESDSGSESDSEDEPVHRVIRHVSPAARPVKKPRLETSTSSTSAAQVSSPRRADESTSNTSIHPVGSQPLSRSTPNVAMPPPPRPVPQAAREASIVPEDFRIPDGADVVTIKDEDDEEDFDFHTTEGDIEVAQARTIDARQLADDMGFHVMNGMVSLEELKQWVDREEDKLAHMHHRIKILTYALHFEGVTDFQLNRIEVQLQNKGKWEPKFAAVLNHPRRGRTADGEPPRRA